MVDLGKLKDKDSIKVKFIIGFLTVILIVFMFPKGESIESEVSVGSIWTQNDLIANLSFPVKKDVSLYNNEINMMETRVYPVYIENKNAVQQVVQSLQDYNKWITSSIDSSLEKDSNYVNHSFLTSTSFKIFREIRIQEKNRTGISANSLRQLFNISQTLLTDLTRKGVLNEIPLKGNKDSIASRVKNFDKIIPIKNYLSIPNGRNYILEKLSKIPLQESIKTALFEYINEFITPTLIYQADLTDKEIKQAKNNVSKFSDIVNENERIVGTHDRITKTVKAKIDSYREAKGEILGKDKVILQFFGKFLHITFILVMFIIYIFLFRKRIFYDNQKILLLSINIVFLSFVTFLINQITIDAPIQLLIFIPAASMLLTIIFDSRIGFYTTVILALVTGALRGNDYSFMAANLFAGALSVYTVRDIKNRTQIFRSFQFILIAYITTILAFGFERFASWQSLFIEFAFAGSNALISPVLTYGLLIFFERFFAITTDLTLLELSNFERPLLKDLASKTPGTFSHSMTIGTLVEAASEKIGANSLLARVGAYYHDIGKTLSPQTFVENQLSNDNIHESISPEESVAIILKHIEEGIKLAEESNLPQEIIDFISMHHGTMVLNFFYEKAKKLYGEDKVDINNYRYKGPKPNTKETAILMLADGCESATRAMKDAEKTKIENLIDNLIKSRIDDLQLNESPLTFSDITIIKECFKNVLVGQHHKRIRYPKQEQMENSKDQE
ncbi:MAG: hydrolase [Ignavibacteriales bacterium CG_4_9_14_3_um_filter_30_11]|nr:MAG: hydrolase [Ignavibacteriales bacterium CG_4_9_14_3_um_filter_30_11]